MSRFGVRALCAMLLTVGAGATSNDDVKRERREISSKMFSPGDLRFSVVS